MIGGEVRVGRALRLDGLRGAGARRVRRTGLEFFAGVTRRFDGSLALVLIPSRRLLGVEGVRPRTGECIEAVRSGTKQVRGLVRRLVRFHGTRANFLRLRARVISVRRFMGCVASCFAGATTRGGVRFSVRVRSSAGA